MNRIFSLIFFLFPHAAALHSQEHEHYGESLIERSSAVNRFFVKIDVSSTNLLRGEFRTSQYFLFEDVPKKTKKLFRPSDPNLNIIYKKGKMWFQQDLNSPIEKTPTGWLVDTDFFEAVTHSPAKMMLEGCKTGNLLTTLSQGTILKKVETKDETILDVQVNPRTRAQYVFSDRELKLPIRASMRVAWDTQTNRTIESDDERAYIVHLFENQAEWKKHKDIYLPTRLELEYTFGSKTAIPQTLLKLDLKWLVKEQIEMYSNEEILSKDFDKVIPTLFE